MAPMPTSCARSPTPNPPSCPWPRLPHQGRANKRQFTLASSRRPKLHLAIPPFQRVVNYAESRRVLQAATTSLTCIHDTRTLAAHAGCQPTFAASSMPTDDPTSYAVKTKRRYSASKRVWPARTQAAIWKHCRRCGDWLASSSTSRCVRRCHSGRH